MGGAHHHLGHRHRRATEAARQRGGAPRQLRPRLDHVSTFALRCARKQPRCQTRPLARQPRAALAGAGVLCRARRDHARRLAAPQRPATAKLRNDGHFTPGCAGTTKPSAVRSPDGNPSVLAGGKAPGPKPPS
eukprot:scaffold22807_cov98-Isochrysis_galbana.AAC.2